MSVKNYHAEIVGNWKTRIVWINGKRVTFSGFVRDLKSEGDSNDIIRECKGVNNFSWGDTSQATYCLALACCFYLNFKWVMDRFFEKELEGVRQEDIRLVYDNDKIQEAYLHCEELFAQEFTTFMDKLGAKRIDEN
jgi:hypothetical protein